MKKKYSAAAEKKIGKVMHEFKEGTLNNNSGDTVKSRAQAIVIGISSARHAHLKVPPQKKVAKKKL